MFTNLKYKREIFYYYGIFDREDYIKDKIRMFLSYIDHSVYPSYSDFMKFKDIFNYFENKWKRKSLTYEEWVFYIFFVPLIWKALLLTKVIPLLFYLICTWKLSNKRIGDTIPIIVVTDCKLYLIVRLF